MKNNIFKFMCSTLLALCIGVFTSCAPLGNPDFKFKKEYEVLMGKWICNSYLEGEPYTMEFTFHKNGKVNFHESFEGDDSSSDMLFNIEGDLSEGAEVIIFGEINDKSVKMTFIVTVNGDEAIFINEERGELVFKQG